MTDDNRWMLPEGIEEALPDEAERLERLRRRVLDLHHAWGYELVMPPLIEYLESLLTGAGSDLDLQTFKLTDQLTGRMMGVRADMTPQAARIDAHRLRREMPVRLCYMGTVLRTRGDGLGGSRSPLQVGAELFGHAGSDSDVEIIGLMIETLRACGVAAGWMDLGHVAIYRGLVAQAGLNPEDERELFTLLQRKALPEIDEFLAARDLASHSVAMLGALAMLNGGLDVLDEARARLARADHVVLDAIDEMQRVAEAVLRRHPGIELHVDLAELRGYRYKTGIVFAAYVAGYGQEVARGGRYDDIGRVFGRARPATGFSTDLRVLARLSVDGHRRAGAIFAPAQGDAALDERICELRAQGERVIRALAGQSAGPAEMGCDRVLERSSDGWNVKPVGTAK